jgi:5-methylthioadenosine/S-adenosylhomocysteine deaminase
MTDILVKHGFVLTMRGEGVGMLEDGAVAIEDNTIKAIGKTYDLEKRFKSVERVFDAHKKAVLPGLVDAHIHTSLSLLRGEAQDVPEIEWMLKTMAPFTRHMEPEHRVKGSALGVLEALKSGTTCFGEIGGDMALITEKVFTPSGVRAHIANTVNEIGPQSQTDPNKPYLFQEEIGEQKLKEGVKLVEKYHDQDNSRITCMLAPHAADMMSRELLLRVRDEADRLGVMMHMHIAQGGREDIQMKLRYGKSTVRFLDEMDFLSGRLLAAHCHQTSDEEVKLLAKRGVHYVSCPSSISLIDGITPPLALYLNSGGRAAALGTDQASGNNCHNLLMEMKVAALLNKTRHRDPTVLPAWKMLRIATIEGARAMGLGTEIGSLETGKKADLIILNMKMPHMMPLISSPVRNIAPNIVYSARGDEVETVIIDGEVVLDEGELKTMDEEKILHEAQEAAETVTNRARKDFFNAGSRLVDAVKKGLL